MKKVAAVAIIVFASTLTCLAGPSIAPCATVNPKCAQVPEIDMSSIGTASALVGCMVFMLRGRRKSQQYHLTA